MKFIGWDWASHSHDVTVLDATGGVVDRLGVQPYEDGLISALQRLARHGPPVELPVTA